MSVGTQIYDVNDQVNRIFRDVLMLHKESKNEDAKSRLMLALEQLSDVESQLLEAAKLQCEEDNLTHDEQVMENDQRREMEWEAEARMAQFDDDPSPYAGNYSEE